MDNHDTPEVVIISAWLDTLSEREAWRSFMRWAWRRLVYGSRHADRWLLDCAIVGVAEDEALAARLGVRRVVWGEGE